MPPASAVAGCATERSWSLTLLRVARHRAAALLDGESLDAWLAGLVLMPCCRVIGGAIAVAGRFSASLVQLRAQNCSPPCKPFPLPLGSRRLTNTRARALRQVTSAHRNPQRSLQSWSLQVRSAGVRVQEDAGGGGRSRYIARWTEDDGAVMRADRSRRWENNLTQL